MQDLTGRFSTVLTPTSQGGGNTLTDPAGHKLAMTAPGSDSVNPLPLPPGRVDNIVDTAGDNPQRQPTVITDTQGHPGSVRPGDGGGFKDAHTIPSGGPWKETT